MPFALLDLKFFENDDELFQSRDWKERYSKAARLRLCCPVGQAISSPAGRVSNLSSRLKGGYGHDYIPFASN